MKLGIKFAVFLVVPLVGLMVAFGYTYQQTSQAQLREELARECRMIALVFQTAAEDYLRDRQAADLHKLIDEISGYERVLGLRLFDPEGRVVYQSAALDPYPFENRELLVGVLRDRAAAEMRRRVGEQWVVGFLFPLTGAGGRLEGAGQVLQLESYIEADARANRRFILSLTLAMGVAAATIVMVVTRLSVTRPIARLTHSIGQVGEGDLGSRVPVHSQDELGVLASEFNRMCERLETAHRSLESEQQKRLRVEGRLRSAQRLASLGRLAAGLAHEIGTPLNVISGRTEALQRHLPDDPRATRALAAISAQSDRIVRIVRDMLDFARMKAPRRGPTSLAEVIQSVLAAADMPSESGTMTVRVNIPGDFPKVTADADQLHQVFHNLITNARDAMSGGGTLDISARAWVGSHPERGGPPRRYASLLFQDTGVGIAPEDREHVFDPFFTSKQPGQGMGLGLAVAYGIVEEHGGWFDLESRPGQGTRVTVHLPVEDASVPDDRASEGA